MHRITHRQKLSIIIIVLAIILPNYTSAQVLDKKYTYDFQLENVPVINVVNKFYNLDVVESKTQTTKLELILTAKSEDQSELDVLDKALSNFKFNQSQNRLQLKFPLWERDIEYKFLFFGAERVIKFNGGDALKIEFVNVKAILHIPEGSSLTVDSRYSTVNLPNLKSLELTSYNDDIVGRNVESNMIIDAKYSKLEFDTLPDSEIKTNDTKIRCKKAGNLNITSRNSNFNIPNMGNVIFSGTYDDIRFDKMGDLTANMKYVNIIGKECKKINVKEFYNVELALQKSTSINMTTVSFSDLDISKVSDITISNTKLSKYKFDITGNIEIQNSYNDFIRATDIGEIEIGICQYSTIEAKSSLLLKLHETKGSKYYIDRTGDINVNNADNDEFRHNKNGNISFGESKYCSFVSDYAKNVSITSSHSETFRCDTIETAVIVKSFQSNFYIKKLQTKFSLIGQFDQVKIMSVSKNLKYISFENKSGNIFATIPKSVDFRIDADIQYGALNFDKKSFTASTDINESNVTKYVGYKGMGSEKSPYLKIRGYNVDLNLGE